MTWRMLNFALSIVFFLIWRWLHSSLSFLCCIITLLSLLLLASYYILPSACFLYPGTLLMQLCSIFYPLLCCLSPLFLLCFRHFTIVVQLSPTLSFFLLLHLHIHSSFPNSVSFSLWRSVPQPYFSGRILGIHAFKLAARQIKLHFFKCLSRSSVSVIVHINFYSPTNTTLGFLPTTFLALSAERG